MNKHTHVADMAISTLKLGFKHLPIEKQGAFTQAITDLEAFAKTPSVNSELLEALRAITDYTYESSYCGALKNIACRCNTTCPIVSVVSKARATIAKATGATK